MLKRIVISCVAAALTLAAASANALTKFEQDVSDTIDRGLSYLDKAGAFANPSAAGEAAGLSMLALLEKRKSGNQLDAADGYSGASDADKARLRKVAAYIMYQTKNPDYYSFYTYRDGNFLMALSVYRLTGGPDKGESDMPNTADYPTLNEAIASLVDRIIAKQGTDPAMWSYTGPGSDSSTTQFAAAGLGTARRVYASAAYADSVRLDKINTALTKAKDSYEKYAKQGWEYANSSTCPSVLTVTERGHGYYTGATPSLQQTASGLWVQLLGGSGPSTPMVQNYAEWLKNRYHWSQPGHMWGGNSYWYYLWSSFKSMQLLREAGGSAIANKLGTLDPAAAPKCADRQVNQIPTGDYAGTAAGQYFDYAVRIMSNQCKTGASAGDFSCGAEPTSWEGWIDRNPYAILVLQRSTGGACVDVKPPFGQCDPDESATAYSTCDLTGDGNVTMDDVMAMLPWAQARTPTGASGAPASADAVGFGPTGPGTTWWDIQGDGEINIADFTRCLFKAYGR